MNCKFIYEFLKLVEVYGVNSVNAAVHVLLSPPGKTNEKWVVEEKF